MENILLIFRHIYQIARTNAANDDVRLMVSLYYHMVSFHGYRNTKALLSSMDDNWSEIYTQYIKDGHYNFNPEELYEVFENELIDLHATQKAINLFKNNRNNFESIVKKSRLLQPKVSNRVAALYERTTDQNFSYHH